MLARSPGSAKKFVNVGVMAGLLMLGGGEGVLRGRDLVTIASAEETVESPGAVRPPPAGESTKLRPTRSNSAPATRDKFRAKEKDKAAKDKAAKEPPPPDLTLPLQSELRSSSEDQAIAAVKKLGEMGTPRAVEVLLDELATGLTPRISKAALDVIAARKATDGPSPIPVLALYAHHRNPELRQKALATLAALPQPAAVSSAVVAGSAPGVAPGVASTAAPAASPVVPLLLAALSDQNSDVRTVAAQALGARHEKSAEPALIKLLLRKDPAAPEALGQIGGPDTARALAEMIGNVPDRMILETLGALLMRTDFGPEPVRVQVVKTVGKMPGNQTLEILGDYVKETTKDKLRPSRLEAQKIIEQRTAK